MPEYYWNPRTKRFHNKANNDFVKKSEIEKHLATDQARSKVRMQAQSRLLIAGAITLAQWQENMMGEIKRSHLRGALLSAGGKNNISNNGYLGTARLLKKEYGYLRKFAKAIAAGELSEQRIIWRSGLYGNSSTTSFSQSELITHRETGARYGKRLLDPQAIHCNSCIRHERKNWVPIEEIVPRSVDCECHQSCKCRVFYSNSKRNLLSDRLTG